VQADRHHLRAVEARGVAFGVQRVERVAQVRVELLAAVEALRRREPHVVGVERVRHDEVRHPAARAVDAGPVRQVVRVAVGVVQEAAVLDDQPARVGAVAARVPAQRRRAGEPRDRVDGTRDVLALDVLGHVLVADPAPAVARDLVAVAQVGVDERGAAQQRHPDAEDRQRDAALAEQPQQAPRARARPVLVERLHAHVARAERLRADDVGQERLRGGVAVQHGVLAAFLVVQHELDRDPRAARPARMRRILAVAGEVARVAWLEGGGGHGREASPRQDTAERFLLAC